MSYTSFAVHTHRGLNINESLGGDGTETVEMELLRNRVEDDVFIRHRKVKSRSSTLRDPHPILRKNIYVSLYIEST